jgi:hypothetical protein
LKQVLLDSCLKYDNTIYKQNETFKDCPWCEVKASHAGHKFIKTRMPAAKKENWNEDILVKGRNEPAAIV